MITLLSNRSQRTGNFPIPEDRAMSKTDENLKIAFSGESQARNRFAYYARIACHEGYHYIDKIFEETA